MKYKVIVTENAKKQFKKMDKHNLLIIKKWIEKNLIDCENPRDKGRALCGNLAGKWRYRVGEYRIVAEIRDMEVIIYLISVSHRKDIYEKFNM